MLHSDMFRLNSNRCFSRFQLVQTRCHPETHGLFLFVRNPCGRFPILQYCIEPVHLTLVQGNGFGSILAYGLIHMEGVGGLRGWRWIFIIEVHLYHVSTLTRLSPIAKQSLRAYSPAFWESLCGSW